MAYFVFQLKGFKGIVSEIEEACKQFCWID